MKRPAYIFDPLIASLDSPDLLRISEQLGNIPRMIATKGSIKQLVLEVIGTGDHSDILLIPTRPEHCTPMIRKVQAIALQMDMEVMPVCSFLSRSSSAVPASEQQPGTVAAAPTTSNASVSGQPITEPA